MAFSEADVQRAVEELAKLGIETRVRPADPAPIAAVTGKPSPIRLLRVQVRNLALESVAGGGTRGADLDAIGTAGGGGPVSALLAGWAAAGTTPGAKLAASLLARGGPPDAAAKVFPTLAVIAFVADVNAGGAQTSARSQTALLALSSSDYCAEISAYLSGALGNIVDANADPPAWLKGLIDLYAPQYANNAALLRKTIGAIALLSYAVSLAKSWTVSLLPDPASIAYGIDGQDAVTGDVNLAVLSGADVFGKDVADCASLANAQLASVPVKGSTVIWDNSGLDGHAKEATAEPKVDENGAAGLTYTMTTESKDTADNGDPVSAQMSVNAWVDRAEMAALAAVVKSILLGDAAGSPAGSTAKALYQAMEPTLNTVMRPSGFALIDVTHHTPKASPGPSQTALDLTGTWDGTWVIDPPYADVMGGFSMVITQSGGSFSGPIDVTGPVCAPQGTVSGSVTGSSVTFGWVLAAHTTDFAGTVRSTSMSGTWASISCDSQQLSLTGTWQATKR